MVVRTQTVGKRITGIAVLDEASGAAAGIGRSVIRRRFSRPPACSQRSGTGARTCTRTVAGKAGPIDSPAPSSSQIAGRSGDCQAGGQHAIAQESASFCGPVYLFNGDSHVYNSDQPLTAGSKWLSFYGLRVCLAMMNGAQICCAPGQIICRSSEGAF
jgi:hypothetical protein